MQTEFSNNFFAGVLRLRFVDFTFRIPSVMDQSNQKKRKNGP